MEHEMEELITQGRRDLVCGDIHKAVDSFQKACEALSKIHGDFHEALAIPNLLYGTALLELSRIESSVIGNALDGIPDEDKDDSESDDGIIEPGPELSTEEKEDISNQVIDAMCEEKNPENGEHKESSSTNEDIETVSNNDAATENTTDDTVKEAKDDESNESDEGEPENQDDVSDNPTDTEAAKSNDNDDEDDDVSSLQIAWEVIEVAKKLFSQKEDDASKLNVAECLEKLGEISREKEDYDQAVMDLKECLEIRNTILGQKDRRVAESHYQLGTTYAVSGDLENASSSFKASVECLKLLAEDLKSKIEADDQKEEEKELLRISLKEIELLIPDVQSRCADIEEDRLTEGIKKTDHPMKSCSNGASVPTDDISHLVRKKRPVSGTAPVENINPELNGHENPTSKKVKLMNANGETTPVENGV